MKDNPGDEKIQVRVEKPRAESGTSNSSSSTKARKRSIKEICGAVLLSLQFQGSMQIAAGVFVASLFTFVEPIHFQQSCTIVTFFLVVAVQSSVNSHLGTRVNAAASVFGAMWIAAMAGGVVASLSKLAGPQTGAGAAVLCVLGCLVICVMSCNRVTPLPPGLWAIGMTNCLTFGIVCINSWKSTTIVQVWHIAAYTLLSSAIACSLSVLTAALVLPSLASQEAQSILADVLQSAGVGTSRYAARLFRPPAEGSLPKEAAAAVASLVAAATATATATATKSKSHKQKSNSHISGGASATSSTGTATTAAAAPAGGPGMDDSKQHVITADVTADVTADMEEEEEERMYSLGLAAPALIVNDEMTDEQWLAMMERNSDPDPRPSPKGYRCPMPQLPVMSLRPKLAQVNNFLLPAAAAEPQWLRSGFSCSSSSTGWFEAQAWGKIVASLQLLISRLSALEAVVEDGESLNLTDQFHPKLLQRLSLVYTQTATSLALLSETVKNYGSSSSSKSSSSKVAAAGSFCEMVMVFGRSWKEAKDDLATCMQEEVNYHWQAVMSAAQDSPTLLPSLSSVRHLMFTWCLTNGVIDAIDQLEKALAAAVCACPPPSLLQASCGWLLPLLPQVAGADMFRNWVWVLGTELPAVLRQGRAGIRATASSPIFQAGFKYALVLCLLLVATVLALYFDPLLAQLNPVYGFVAAALSMSERVEATFTKVSFWVVGTLVGGALGLVAMFHPALAGNVCGLAAIIAAYSFLVGSFMPSRFKVLITLSLMALTAIVLCQCCQFGVAGNPMYAVTRVVSVLSGVLFAVAVCNTLLPWYMSDWALRTMAATYQRCIAAVMEMQVKSWDDGAAAVASFEMSCSEQELAMTSLLGAATQQQQEQQQQHELFCTGPIRHDCSDAEAAAAAAAVMAEAVAAARQQLELLQPPPSAAAAAAPPPPPPTTTPTPTPAATTPTTSSSSGTGGDGSSSGNGATVPQQQQQQQQRLVTCGDLQALIARPLVAVQGTLMRDAVAWQKGVLATPPVVPKLLRVMLGVLDRLSALQLSLSPPIISGRFTGYHMVHYAVPMNQLQADIMPLLADLGNVTCRALLQPSHANGKAVQTAIDRLVAHRMKLFKMMKTLRQQLHHHVIQEQQRHQQCTAAAAAAAAAADAPADAPADAADAAAAAAAAACTTGACSPENAAARRRRLAMLIGGVDDVVRFLSFQFAAIKAVDRLTAAARLAAADVCRQARNNKLSALK